MNQAERLQVAAYVRTCADDLGMRDWTITILPEPPGEDEYATCHVPYNRREAILRFSEETPLRSKEDIRRTVAHELLHAYAWRMRFIVTAIEDQITDAAWRVFKHAWEAAEESLVCDLSRSGLFEALPLPDFGFEPDEPEAVAE